MGEAPNETCGNARIWVGRGRPDGKCRIGRMSNGGDFRTQIMQQFPWIGKLGNVFVFRRGVLRMQVPSLLLLLLLFPQRLQRLVDPCHDDTSQLERFTVRRGGPIQEVDNKV